MLSAQTAAGQFAVHSKLGLDCSGGCMTRIISGLLLVTLLLRPHTGRAQSCTVSTLPTVFGSYNIFSGAPLTGTGAVTVTCSAALSLNVSYSIAGSTGSSGNYSGRNATSGTGTLAYQLYTTPAHTTVWGNGNAGTGLISDSYLLSVLQTSKQYQIYGQIPAQQNLSSGSYTDTVFVTVIY